MSISQAFHSWLRRGRWPWQSTAVVVAEEPVGTMAMIRAHGICLSLLATILEREGVIMASELARLLGEFATVTAAEQPDEGRILTLWAACLDDTAAVLRDRPAH